MEASEKRRIIEALILASGEPIGLDALARVVPGSTPAEIKSLIGELNAEYEQQFRAFEIWEVAGGYQIRTRAEFSGYLQQLRRERPLRLSQAALETLSIVAYRQPASRAEVDEVRGVDSGAVLKSLLDRRLLRILGHRDVPGRPLIYGTSKRFLEVFGLGSLKELPGLRELEELAREQGVEIPGLPGLSGENSDSDPEIPFPENPDEVSGAESEDVPEMEVEDAETESTPDAQGLEASEAEQRESPEERA